MKQREFKVGDKVYTNRFGWGKVINVSSGDIFPIEVIFDKEKNNFTEEGYYEVNDFAPMLSHYEYYTQPNERVVLVSVDGMDWVRRVFVTKKQGKFVCWINAESIEEAEGITVTNSWKYMKELPTEEIVELTFQEISEGKGVGVPPHLIRIKEQ